MRPIALFDCVTAKWSPTLGDPTVMGWITVAAYLVACILAFMVFRRQDGRQRLFWLILSFLLLALTINKQLDLQSALTATGRCLARAQGWYANRQSVQITFILSIIAVSFLAVIVLLWTMRKELTQIWMALFGFAFLLAFVAIRAAGFHHFDRFIGSEIGNIRMNWVFEIGGITLIVLNAFFLLSRASRVKRNAERHRQ